MCNMLLPQKLGDLVPGVKDILSSVQCTNLQHHRGPVFFFPKKTAAKCFPDFCIPQK